MQRFVSALAVVVVLAALLHAAARPAFGCSCEYGPRVDEAYAAKYLERDLVVVARVDAWEPLSPETGSTTAAQVTVERVYGGFAPRTLTIHSHDSSGCGYEEALREGGRHLMALRDTDSGTWGASYCSSWRLPETDSPQGERGQLLVAFVNMLGQISPPRAPTAGIADNPADEDAPPRWIVPSVLALGLASLVGLTAWFVRTASNDPQR